MEDEMSNLVRIRASVAAGLVLALLSLSAGTRPAAAEDAPKPKEVVIKKHQYLVDGKKQPLEITAGDSVVWVNEDDEKHDATPDKKGDFEGTGDIAKGKKSKAVTFAKAGKFNYHCSYHDEMTGTIVVKER
jgi:plastocyanin